MTVHGPIGEHEVESKNVDWSHAIAPWINFFQNVDAIVGPDEPVIYPEHLTEELDYELELAVVLRKGGTWLSPEEAPDYIGGYMNKNIIQTFATTGLTAKHAWQLAANSFEGSFVDATTKALWMEKLNACFAQFGRR